MFALFGLSKSLNLGEIVFDYLAHGTKITSKTPLYLFHAFALRNPKQVHDFQNSLFPKNVARVIESCIGVDWSFYASVVD